MTYGAGTYGSGSYGDPGGSGVVALVPHAVYLTELWLHDAGNLADVLRLRIGPEGEDITQDVAVRKYANGVVRSVQTPGELRALRFDIHKLGRDDFREFQGRIGRLQMLRDPRGRKHWGMIAGTAATEWRPKNEIETMPFTFLRVTYSEVV